MAQDRNLEHQQRLKTTLQNYALSEEYRIHGDSKSRWSHLRNQTSCVVIPKLSVHTVTCSASTPAPNSSRRLVMRLTDNTSASSRRLDWMGYVRRVSKADTGKLRAYQIIRMAEKEEMVQTTPIGRKHRTSKQWMNRVGLSLGVGYSQAATSTAGTLLSVLLQCMNYRHEVLVDEE